MATNELRLLNSQIQMLWKIQDAINKKRTRISVLVPPNYCCGDMGLYFATWLQNYGSVLIVCDSTKSKKKCSTWINDNGIHDVAAKKIQQLSAETIKSFSYVIFLEISVIGRTQMINVCKEYKGVTISCGSPEFNHDFDDGFPWTFIYSTKKIVDIRDAICADKNEKEKLRMDCLAQIEALKEENRGFFSEDRSSIGSKSDTNPCFGKSSCFCDVVADKSAWMCDCVDPYCADGAFEYEKNKATISFLEQLLLSLGLDKAELKRWCTKIEACRKHLEDELLSENGSVKEQALAKLQKTVIKSAEECKMDFYLAKESRWRQLLRSYLTPEIWDNRLSEDSRRCLITARVTFDSMNPKSKTMDYSGVCMLVTKAIEIEVAERFFYKYLEYLEDCAPDILCWPDSLKRWDCGRERYVPISANQFALGTVVPMIGAISKKDRNGKIVVIAPSPTGRKDHYSWYEMFIKYAGKELYKEKEWEKALKEHCVYIETVRQKFRNPAAHKSGIMRITAEDCFDYVVESEKILKKMLSEMKF